MKKLFILLLGLLMFSSPVFALELDQAKSQGIVGETYTGYLAIVVEKPSPAVKKLVDEINDKRRSEYARIGAKNGTEIAAVEALAGDKLMKKASSGEMIQPQSGRWVKKAG